MFAGIRKRTAAGEGGFTLIETLLVTVLIGYLLAIAGPAYISLRDRASKSAAHTNIRTAVPAIVAYGADNNGYANMHIGGATGLQTVYDTKIKSAPTLTVLSSNATTYCVRATVGTAVSYKPGPAASIASSPACT